MHINKHLAIGHSVHRRVASTSQSDWDSSLRSVRDHMSQKVANCWLVEHILQLGRAPR